MFRFVVVVGIAMVPVILLAALVDPLAGAILFGIEAVVAAGYLVRWLRAAKAQRPLPPAEADEPEPEPEVSPPVDSIR